MLRGQQQIIEENDIVELKTKVPISLKEQRELQKKLKEQSNARPKIRTGIRAESNTK